MAQVGEGIELLLVIVGLLVDAETEVEVRRRRKDNQRARALTAQ